MAKKLLIMRTCEYEFEVPFTSEYYPTGTIEEALEVEKKKTWDEIQDELDGGMDVHSRVEIIDDDDSEGGEVNPYNGPQEGVSIG